MTQAATRLDGHRINCNFFTSNNEVTSKQRIPERDVALACQVYILRAQIEGLGLAEKFDYAVGRPTMSCCLTEKHVTFLTEWQRHHFQ